MNVSNAQTCLPITLAAFYEYMSIMKKSTLLVILSVSSALFACGTTSFPAQPLSEKGQVDRAVKQSAEEKNVIVESVLRDSGKVFLSLRLLDSDGKPTGELYLRADCASKGADWLYADVIDKKTSSIMKERRYAEGASLYSKPLALSASTAGAIHQLNAVKKACDRTPSWREIAYNKKNETQLLLEVSSLQTQADGSVRLWVAVDYPYLAYIRLYKAPYARRAGFYQVDCQKQLYSLLHVYYLDQQQTVTDGGMQVRPPVLSIPQATGDSATMLSTVCSEENLAQALPPPEPRGKNLPNFSVLPEPDARIVAQLAQISHSTPRQSLNAIRVEGTRSSLSGSAAASLNKSGFFIQEIFVEPTPTSGIFSVTLQEGNDRTEQMSFLGMVPISQMLYNTDEQNVSQIDKLDLRGDWLKMPVNSQLGFWQRARITDIVTNQSNREAEVICKVARELSAGELHRQFQGKAKELKCHVVGGKIDEISTYYYLEDYGFTLLLGSRTPKYVVDSRVTGVR